MTRLPALAAAAAAAVAAVAASAAPARANFLVNPGFETGALSPWFQARDYSGSDTWRVTTTDARSGQYSATIDFSNKELRQNFAPVPTAQITEVSFWVRQPNRSTFLLAVDFFYTDGTNHEFYPQTSSGDWQFFDVTGELAAGKELNGFSVWGNSAELTYYDDLVIRGPAAAVPEPASLALAGVGGLGVLIARRRRKSAA